MKLLANMTVEEGELYIGSKSTIDLAEEYSTPLYIVDQENFENTAKTFLDNFVSKKFETRIIYASKAFINLYMASILDDLGLSIDVVSGGELYTALEGGFKPENIYFHGNNKLREEIELAVENNIGTIVIDNRPEFELLKEVLEEKDKNARVLLRINPIIKARTHEYIQTTNEDSKFGMPTGSQRTKDLIREIVSFDKTEFAGIHCHIGSQVLEEESFYKTAEIVLNIGKDISDFIQGPLDEVNLGGGFGVYYTEGDEPFDFEKFLGSYIGKIEEVIEEIDLEVASISIEPGRSLINESGSTLYTIGSVKEMDNSNDYIFIDGGMTDNPRPSLYQAKYEAAIANKMDQDPSQTYTIAGKCCESGDILIKDIGLPKAETGDLLIVPSTGAYNYSMSSNYNRIGRPAVVFVKDGGSRLAVRRETYEDLIKNDVKHMRGE